MGYDRSIVSLEHLGHTGKNRTAKTEIILSFNVNDLGPRNIVKYGPHGRNICHLRCAARSVTERIDKRHCIRA